MNPTRRELIVLSALAGIAAASGQDAFALEQPGGLYRVADPKVILASARALILEDTITTFITLDGNGQPRARSVLASPPDEDLTVWIGTRRGSRKLSQIAANPRATLHFAVDAKSVYLSLMGEAHAETDPVVIKAKNPYSGQRLQTYFPHFPDDFALIAFRPAWLEIMTDSLEGTKDTWQPQGLMLK